MTDVLTEILPLGIAIAASPFPVIPAILLLFTPRARPTSAAYLAGWVVGVGAATAAFVLLATVVEQHEDTPSWAAWTTIVLGSALVVLGVWEWLRRDSQDELPAWMASIDRATPATAARLALLLSAANPKILLLSAAAGLTIGAAELGGRAEAASVAAFTVVASVTVALPLLLYTLLGERVLGPLGRVRTWLQDHNAAVMAVVVTAIGVALVLKGIDGL